MDMSQMPAIARTLKPELYDKIFWIWLSRRLGPGCRWYSWLMEQYGTPYEIFKMGEEELTEHLGMLGEKNVAALCDTNLDEA